MKILLALILITSHIKADLYEIQYDHEHIENSDDTYTYQISLDDKLILRTQFKNKDVYHDSVYYKIYDVISEEWFFKDVVFKRAALTDEIGNFKIVDKKYPDRQALSCPQSNDELVIISETPSKSNHTQLIWSNADVEYEGSGVCAYPRYTWIDEDDIGYIYYGKGRCSSSDYFSLASEGNLFSFRANPETKESLLKGMTPKDRIKKSFCHKDNLELNE